MHPAPTQRSTTRRPWPTLLALAGGVAGLHLVLWQGVASSFAADAPARGPAVVQVRTLSLPPAPAPVAVAQPMPVPTPPRRVTKPPADPAPPPEEAAAPAEPMLVAAAH